MRCGHPANDGLYEGLPVCTRCERRGLPGGNVEEYDQPILTNREACCVYCGAVAKSDKRLRMFRYLRSQGMDHWLCNACNRDFNEGED